MPSGIDVDQRDVFRVLQDGDLVRLRELLEAGPELARSRGADGLTLLQHALYARRPDAIRLLVGQGALQTVHEAAALGDVEALQRLLAAHPDQLDAPGPDGWPPLHMAAHFAQHDALGLLLDEGADLALRSAEPTRNTALHAAAAGGAVSTARILLASGADPDAKDAFGNTPLHVAAAQGAIPVLQALLEGGAGRGRRNGEGKTALDLARTGRKPEAVSILETAGTRA